MTMIHGKFEGGAAGDKAVEVAVDEQGRLIVSPGAAAEATLQAVRDRLPAAQLTPGLLAVDTLATPVRMTFAVAAAANTQVTLAPTTRRVSVDAVGGGVYVAFAVIASAPVAGTALQGAIHIPAGATKDFDVPASTTLNFWRSGTTDATVYVSEIA